MTETLPPAPAWTLRPAPLWMTAGPARCGIKDTDWGGLGIGRDQFRRLVREGVIPSFVDPNSDAKHPVRLYSRLALEDWARRNGVAA